jgi:hypothetical protein
MLAMPTKTGEVAMSKHLADHRAPSAGGRVKHFLRLTREASSIWHRLWQRPRTEPTEGRRVAEFVRIDRGRRT